MKRLIVLLLPALIGWILIGKMDKPDFDKLTLPEQKAVINIVVDKFFNKTSCGKAQIMITTDNKEVLVYALCTEPRLGV